VNHWSPAVGRDRQALRRGIALAVDPIDPEPNAVDGELSGVVVDSKADIRRWRRCRRPRRGRPCRVPCLRNRGCCLDRPALWAIVAAAVLELTEQILLLGVDRYRRLIGRVKLLYLGVNIFELNRRDRCSRRFVPGRCMPITPPRTSPMSPPTARRASRRAKYFPNGSVITPDGRP
jgi:hypothetical protein